MAEAANVKAVGTNGGGKTPSPSSSGALRFAKLCADQTGTCSPLWSLKQSVESFDARGTTCENHCSRTSPLPLQVRSAAAQRAALSRPRNRPSTRREQDPILPTGVLSPLRGLFVPFDVFFIPKGRYFSLNCPVGFFLHEIKFARYCLRCPSRSVLCSPPHPQ